MQRIIQSLIFLLVFALMAGIAGITACEKTGRDAGGPAVEPPQQTKQQPRGPRQGMEEKRGPAEGPPGGLKEQPQQAQPESSPAKEYEGSEVLAAVDGEEISASEVEPIVEQQMQGMQQQGRQVNAQMEQMLRKRVLDNVIKNKLIIQEAKDRNIEVSKEEVEQTYQEQARMLGGESNLNQRLSQAGVSGDEFREQIRQKAVVDKLKEEVAPEAEVTEEEARKFYEDNKEMFRSPQGGEPHEFDEVKDQLMQQLEQRKANQAFGGFVEKLRNDADVEIKAEELKQEAPQQVPQGPAGP